jgi:hypothetical protein
LHEIEVEDQNEDTDADVREEVVDQEQPDVAVEQAVPGSELPRAGASLDPYCVRSTLSVRPIRATFPSRRDMTVSPARRVARNGNRARAILTHIIQLVETPVAGCGTEAIIDPSNERRSGLAMRSSESWGMNAG